MLETWVKNFLKSRINNPNTVMMATSCWQFSSNFSWRDHVLMFIVNHEKG